jgi:hypothetical protein
MSNPSAKIFARHQWRTHVIDGKEVAVEQSFTPLAWNSLGSLRHKDGKLYPKQGFVIVSDVATPNEAKTPPVTKTNTPSTQETPQTKSTVNVDEIEALIKSDAKEKLPVALMLQYFKAKGITIENADKMPAHELFAKLKENLA